MQSRSSRPLNPPIGGGHVLPKGAQICLKEPKVASIQKQNFALRMNGVFALRFYILVLKFFAIVSFQIAS